MIRLIFSIKNQVFALVIKGKEIFYTDKNNKIPKKYIPESEKERLEYEKANSEEELAKICIKDAELTGSILLKREDDKTKM